MGDGGWSDWVVDDLKKAKCDHNGWSFVMKALLKKKKEFIIQYSLMF